ncbi:MAG: hypothetical protein QXG12_06825 [Thermoproteota archaeon]
MKSTFNSLRLKVDGVYGAVGCKGRGVVKPNRRGCGGLRVGPRGSYSSLLRGDSRKVLFKVLEDVGSQSIEFLLAWRNP